MVSDSKIAEFLHDPRTSNVFYCLAISDGKAKSQRVDYPKAIADKTGLTPPNVILHLWRLRNMKIAKLGKKEKKLQHYEVDWNRFRDICVERFPDLDASIERDKEILDQHLKLELVQGEEIKARMRRSPAFARFLKEFFVNHYEEYSFGTKQADGELRRALEEYVPTVLDGIWEIENALNRTLLDIHWKDVNDKNLIELKLLLHDWLKATKAARPLWVDSMRRALNSVGLASETFSGKLYLPR